jgi:2-keto-4-pentenoate hydratase
MLDPQQRQAASDMLWDCWQQGRRLSALPDWLRPATREEGYAVQALLERHTNGPLFGWKIAATSRAGQLHIGVDGPIAGRLLREQARESGARLPTTGNGMRVAEPEFAFHMARELRPRDSTYTMPEVLAAVDALHPAIEVPDSRYENFVKVGGPQLIADDACAHYFVLGPATRVDWRSNDLVDHAVRGIVSGKPPQYGKGANVLGDPRVALTWLANELSRLGIPLGAGQVVTTGTCMTPLAIGPGDTVVADFGELGSVEVRFGD